MNIENDQLVIRPDVIDTLSSFLSVSPETVESKPELLRRVQSRGHRDGLHMPALLSRFNLYGQKYFSGLYDKASQLIRVRDNLAMQQVGLALLSHLARLNPQSTFNRLCGSKHSEYFSGSVLFNPRIRYYAL